VSAPAADRVTDRTAGDWRPWLEVGVFAAILLVAALTRLPGLDARGQWDSDQGHDMAVLAALVQHGQIPLLGPTTSVGTFHHGALYYYLLAPAAALSGADPVAVTVEFALFGIAAVAATWWLGKLVGGPVAAAIAGLLLAVSPAGISESTFIWNPNPIPLFAALAAVGVVMARRTGRVRWWLLAALGTMATMQLHWLGGVLLLPVAGAWLLELRRHRRSGGDASALWRGGLAGALILALGYLPLAVHELTSDWSEARAVVAYLTGGGGQAQTSLVGRLLMVAVRSLTWPVAGVVTDRLAASLAALTVVAVLGTAAVALTGRSRGGRPAGTAAGEAADRIGAADGQAADERWSVRWLVGVLVVSIPALAVLAPSLAVVTPGLPNDHYHAFLDPIVAVLAGAGAAAILRAARPGIPSLRVAGPVVSTGLVVALAAIAVTAWPPAVSPDGGWRLADAAAAHVIDVVDAGWPADEPRLLASLPTFKPDDAMRFPLERRGFTLGPRIVGPVQPGDLGVGVVTIVCDPLFDEATGFACGGPAEDRWLVDAYPPGTMQLAERFRAGSRRVISIYAPSRLATLP
jgi:4-amino-4-deoxy-L-arabinose transferase-like glycosyltransferase